MIGPFQLVPYLRFSVLLFHHALVAFLLGVELSDGKSSKLTKYVYSICFAISISLGIAVGIGITSTDSQDLSNSLNILIVKGKLCFKIF